eukprot:TRINITY_DN7716_c0_g1_i4.p1 TRINITY_DN7716_c0_g1~~TRINITY_DN7716_c0_g1_i4.p1  ORF type:complete len:399 (-),score=67.13 TRINITY_DN7716_c0_g1_i4:166-1362(-)
MSKTLFVVSAVFLLGFCVVAQEVTVPFCECVNATVDCSDQDTLDGLVATLSEIKDVCLNECSDACQTAFYPLHAYHELCPGFGAQAGELYHDLEDSCMVCDLGTGKLLTDADCETMSMMMMDEHDHDKEGGPKEEDHDEHDHDDHDDHDEAEGPKEEGHDDHDDHDHHDHGSTAGVPFCECVNATLDIDCADDATLDGLVQTLFDLSGECINECNDECQEAYYDVHVFHEFCPGFGGEAGEIYHDLAFSCQICDTNHIEDLTGRPECPPVDCSNIADQKELVALLISQECQSNCFTNNECTDAWIMLTSYHENCLEEELSNDLTNEYHYIEENCPPECALPEKAGAAPATVSCGVVRSCQCCANGGVVIASQLVQRFDSCAYTFCVPQNSQLKHRMHL